jgi:hypothetical protein
LLDGWNRTEKEELPRHGGKLGDYHFKPTINTLIYKEIILIYGGA